MDATAALFAAVLPFRTAGKKSSRGTQFIVSCLTDF
jgi:hypothetical protein